MMLQILSYQSWSLDPTFGAPIQVVHNLVVHTLGPIEPPRVHGGFCRQEPHHLRKLTKEKRDPFQGFHEASEMLLYRAGQNLQQISPRKKKASFPEQSPPTCAHQGLWGVSARWSQKVRPCWAPSLLPSTRSRRHQVPQLQALHSHFQE